VFNIVIIEFSLDDAARDFFENDLLPGTRKQKDCLSEQPSAVWRSALYFLQIHDFASPSRGGFAFIGSKLFLTILLGYIHDVSSYKRLLELLVKRYQIWVNDFTG